MAEWDAECWGDVQIPLPAGINLPKNWHDAGDSSILLLLKYSLAYSAKASGMNQTSNGRNSLKIEIKITALHRNKWVYNRKSLPQIYKF